jgi:hypothetical protein
MGSLPFSARRCGSRPDPLVLPVEEPLAEFVGALHLDHPGDLGHRVTFEDSRKP